MNEQQTISRLEALTAEADEEQIERGIAQALACEPKPLRATRLPSWVRSALAPLAALVLVGSAGVATAALTGEDESAQTGPTLSFSNSELGRNCQDHSLAGALVPAADQRSYVAATMTCEDGSDPGLSGEELAKAEAMAIEKTGSFGLPVDAFERGAAPDQSVRNGDTQAP